jgi:hypothetical protein
VAGGSIRANLSAAAGGTGAGYYRNAPSRAGGIGSGAGGGPADSSSWHPTSAYLFGLVIFEAAVLAATRYYFRAAHGG